MNKEIFNLDFVHEGTLVGQLSDNIRRAIATRTLKPGDPLPSIVRMAELCKTSVRIPREAVKILEDEGLLKGRPRSGIVVIGKRRFVWRGSVLFVDYGRQAYYYRGVLYKTLATELAKNGWRVDYANVTHGKSGRADLAQLKMALRGSYRFVFGDYLEEDVLAEIRRSGVPYFSTSGQVGGRHDDATGVFVVSEAEAFNELAASCSARGARRVLRVALDTVTQLFEIPLHERGIETETIRVRPDQSVDRFVHSAAEASRKLRERLADIRKPKPDLVYFADDSLTAAGLWAILAAGLRVPDDVKVVTLSNRGNRPAYRCGLTCIEHDHAAYALRIAREMLAFLAGRKWHRVLVGNARIVPGETF